VAGSNIPRHLKPLIAEAAHRYGIPARVLAGLLDVESNFTTGEVSSAAAFGISQFIPSTAAKYHVQRGSSRRAVRSQIMGAAHLLKDLGYHKNPQFALGAYNGGPGNPQYGYAHQVLADARRLAPQIEGFAQRAGRGGTGTARRGGQRVVGSQFRPSNAASPEQAVVSALLAQQQQRPPQVATSSIPEPAFSARRYLQMPAGYQPVQQAATVQQQAGSNVTAELEALAHTLGPDTSNQSHFTKPSTVGAPGGGGRGRGGRRGRGGLVYHPVRGHGLTIGRTDQGIDYGGQGYLHAAGSGRVTDVNRHSGWPGGTYMVIRLDQPIHGHRYIYYAENISPVVRPGQRVRGGQPVAYQHAGFPHSEIGFSAGPSSAQNTLASARGQVAAGSHYSPQGQEFTNWQARVERRYRRRGWSV
jgi:hypothetical protein